MAREASSKGGANGGPLQCDHAVPGRVAPALGDFHVPAVDALELGGKGFHGGS